MGYNRNLSDVIDSIQDDGPSSVAAAASAGGGDSSAAPVSHARGKRRSAFWIITGCLLAGLLVAGIFLIAVGGTGGFLSSDSGPSAAASANNSQVVDIQLLKLKEQQARLVRQVDQLTAAVADNNKAIQLWLALQDAREEVRLGLQESSPVAQAPVPDQQGLAGTLREADKTVTAGPGAVAAAKNEAGMAAITEPAAVAAAQDTTEQRPGTVEVALSRPVEEAKAAMIRPQPVAVEKGDATDKAVTVAMAVPQARVKETAAAGSATSRDSGDQSWVVNLAFFEKQEAVAELMERFLKAGIDTEQQKITVKGRAGYRLRVTGFSSHAEASNYANNKIGDSFGIGKPWVSRQQ